MPSPIWIGWTIFPGVDPDFKKAAKLEKAQTYIDAAVASRTATERDENFVSAEKELQAFIKQGEHPRQSEARAQLGKLQMVRAAQLLVNVDDEKRKAARESYLAAAKTFDEIVEDLKGKLTAMKGQKIDPKDDKMVRLRDQYRGEFLEAKLNSGETRKLAALTFKDPAKDGKKLLEEAAERFKELSETYDGYVQGALAMLYRGQVQHEMGKIDEATDSYMRMLEMQDADPLRDGKYQAATGLTRLWMAESPPNFDKAIERAKPLMEWGSSKRKTLAFGPRASAAVGDRLSGKVKRQRTKAHRCKTCGVQCSPIVDRC